MSFGLKQNTGTGANISTGASSKSLSQLPNIQHRTESMSRYTSLPGAPSPSHSAGPSGSNLRRIQPMETPMPMEVVVEAAPPAATASSNAVVDYSQTPVVVVEGKDMSATQAASCGLRSESRCVDIIAAF